MSQKLVMVRKRSTVPPVPAGGGEWVDGQRWSSGQTGIWSRFSYTGSFRTPTVSDSTGARFGFIRSACHYDESNPDTLIVGCHDHFHRRACRLSIPGTLVQHGGFGTAGSIPRASMLSAGSSNGFVDITDGQWVQWIVSSTAVHLGDVAILNGKIYWVQEPHYDGNNAAHNVFLGFSDNTLDLLNLNGVGPSSLDGLHYKNCCRNICVIPETWANAHVGGKRLLLGCMGISVRSGSTMGPTAVAVEVPTAAGQSLANQVLMRFPDYASSELEDIPFFWPTIQRNWHNGMWGYGMVLVEDGSDLWLIINGNYYLGHYGYKDSSNPCGATTGYQGYPNRHFLMTFNMADILAAENPWDVVPREIIDCHEFTMRQNDCLWGSARGGLTYDSVGKRLIFMETKADTTGGENKPVFHVFTLDGGA